MKYCQYCGEENELKTIAKYAPNGHDVLQCQVCKAINIPFVVSVNIVILQSEFKVVDDILPHPDIPRKIVIHPRHSNYWIENEILHESYHTIRGLRYREVLKVPGMADDNNCSLDCLNYITKNYLE